ncbi:hypothetical protein GCM10010095_72040 [Streptomyces anthocyanicus]|uniref:Phosphoadenosine phosphosulphate reductase domain-containing protein n=1 Tax=Streptomyces violaceolatus TaxID=67378 RepID=A0ABN3TFA1_9ACTN|nr:MULTISPECIES: hypothetical protein [Streptomyces]GGL76537.1 hypothetical protein GCM10010095_72040 [Streptomyces anthocyanicus]GHC32942.1 hypothetical protein GCM10010348_69760 [Streptomyces anthocyanicus]
MTRLMYAPSLPGFSTTDGLDTVINWGLGADSTAYLARMLTAPAAHDIDLERTAVLYMATGSEWPETRLLVEEFMLPLLREHGVRLVHLSRNGHRKEDGFTVLDDSRSPEQLIARGPWTLWDDLESVGTVPQQAGTRKCSLWAKGAVGDWWLAQVFGGRPFRQVMGFNADEAGRCLRDETASKLPGRTGLYPLLDWGWGRRKVEEYLLARFGVHWPKSYCTFCFMWNRAGLACSHGPDTVGQVPHSRRGSTGSPLAAVHSQHRASTQHDRRVRAGGRGPPAVLRSGRHGPAAGPLGHRRCLDQGHAGPAIV